MHDLILFAMYVIIILLYVIIHSILAIVDLFILGMSLYEVPFLRYKAQISNLNKV